MVPVRAIIKAWRRLINRLDDATVDKNDPEQAAAYEKRKGTKHGILKAPYVIANIFKKLGGKKKTKEVPEVHPATARPHMDAAAPLPQQATVMVAA